VVIHFLNRALKCFGHTMSKVGAEGIILRDACGFRIRGIHTQEKHVPELSSMVHTIPPSLSDDYARYRENSEAWTGGCYVTRNSSIQVTALRIGPAWRYWVLPLEVFQAVHYREKYHYSNPWQNPKTLNETWLNGIGGDYPNNCPKESR
jgi:hypothetical protein